LNGVREQSGRLSIEITTYCQEINSGIEYKENGRVGKLYRMRYYHHRVGLSTMNKSHQQNMNSPSAAGNSSKYAIMVGNSEHFKAAILTADQIISHREKSSVEVILVGEMPQAITEDNSLIHEIDKAEKLGVKIKMCEVAMVAHKVKKSKLDKRITTVRNGWIHMFDLKDQGYNTLST
jgi:intracellular sulfur oxidation DsrE/DsrF family protein